EADATLTVLDSAFIGNVATGSPSPAGGGVVLRASGGALDNEGGATVRNTRFADNQAVGGSGPRGTAASGGAIFNGIYQAGQGLNAILSVSHSTFTDNQALGGSGLSDSGGFALGGALSNKGGATLVLSQSPLIRNQGIAGGGGGGGNRCKRRVGRRPRAVG